MLTIGPHRYDSVVFTGHLRWQDRLNSLNLPFFLSSTGLFTNYTVRYLRSSSFPSRTQTSSSGHLYIHRLALNFS